MGRYETIAVDTKAKMVISAVKKGMHQEQAEKKNGQKSNTTFCPFSAVEQIRTVTPGKRRYHLKVVRLPISPPPHSRG